MFPRGDQQPGASQAASAGQGSDPELRKLRQEGKDSEPTQKGVTEELNEGVIYRSVVRVK